VPPGRPAAPRDDLAALVDPARFARTTTNTTTEAAHG
jgi:hypothetical protein